MRLRLTPPQTFAVISLLVITAILVVTSLTQSTFFRRQIIDHESVIIRDMVDALAANELSSLDMEHYDWAAAQVHFEHSFGALKNLSGVVRVKVFNRDKMIVWSDEPSLIGKKITAHDKDLTMAMGGEVHAVFSDSERASLYRHVEGLPPSPLIEFYVPFSLPKAGAANDTVSGVLSLYRSPQELNNTIQHGLFLLWLVTGLGGIILFAALYKLFRTVYRRQREVESQFAKLSADHERILQIEKLSAMGQMMSEIAHQLNNPLVGVINLAQLAEREMDNPQRVKELLGEVHKAGEHCRSFVQRMLRFTKAARSEPRPIELKWLIRETIVFFQQSVGGHHAVTLEAPDRDVIIEVDPVLMRHALFNLITNAVQADPSGSVVISISSDEHEGVSGYRLAVSDCGPGIKPELMDKLFTPFFTTKSDGTGLGLTVVQHVVVQHGGVLHAENRPGGGACFTIWLPAQRRTHEIENPTR